MSRTGTFRGWRVLISSLAIISFCRIGQIMGSQMFTLWFSDEISVEQLKTDLSQCHWVDEKSANTEQNWSVEQTAKLLAKVFPKEEKIIKNYSANILLALNNFKAKDCEERISSARSGICTRIRAKMGWEAKPSECFVYNLVAYCEEVQERFEQWCDKRYKFLEKPTVDNEDGVQMFPLRLSDEISVEGLKTALSQCYWMDEKSKNTWQNWSVEQTAELLAKVFPKEENIIENYSANILLALNNFKAKDCEERIFSLHDGICTLIKEKMGEEAKPSECLVYNLVAYCEEVHQGLKQWCGEKLRVGKKVNFPMFTLRLPDKKAVKKYEAALRLRKSKMS